MFVHRDEDIRLSSAPFSRGRYACVSGANNGKQDEGTGPWRDAPDVARESAQAPAEASQSFHRT